jgi:acyl dehydratase/NADP-dependent 3-hydroxy acid dehydrogenase YdfG
VSDPVQATFAITLDASLAFAELSGDCNPLHIDPVAARRTQFGSTVVHGIHAALKAVDELAGLCLPPGHEIEAATATFQNPVRTGAPVKVSAEPAGADGRLRIKAESSGRPAFTLTLKLAVGASADTTRPPRAGRPARDRPKALPFPPDVESGAVPLLLDPKQLQVLFPNLSRRPDTGWIADLAATTRIVGMECPGLDSIYSGFKLTRVATSDSSARPETMTYGIQKLDPRFRLARLAVSGAYFSGVLDTFFRPPAVAQRALADVLPAIDRARHATEKALVVGGSRGLGEVAAKILLAGGARVTVTYARGRDDAARLCAEAASAGLPCESQMLDLSRPLAASERAWLLPGAFTHLYFFASPHIEKNATGRWDHALFERFTGVYVRGFCEIVEALAPSGRGTETSPMQVLYPSTVFLDTREPGFAEYCAAKAAGEMAAQHLMQSLHVRIRLPRLPRMRTDQTSALVDVGVADAFPVIFDALGTLKE